MLTPTHTRVGDQQDLQLPPPHPPPGSGRRRDSVHRSSSRDVGLLHRPPRLQLRFLVVDVVGGLPVHAAQHVLADQQQALVQAAGHQRRQAPPQMGGHRNSRRLIQHPLEMGPGQVPDRHLADHRRHEPPTVRLLILPMTVRPPPPPRRPASRVQIPRHQHPPPRRRQPGRRPRRQPLHQLPRLGHRRRPRPRRGIPPPISLHPPQPPIPPRRHRLMRRHPTLKHQHLTPRHHRRRRPIYRHHPSSHSRTTGPHDAEAPGGTRGESHLPERGRTALPQVRGGAPNQEHTLAKQEL